MHILGRPMLTPFSLCQNIPAITKEIEGKTEAEVRRYAQVFWARGHELEDWDKHLVKILEGEKKIERQHDINRAVQLKVKRYKNPLFEMKFNYGALPFLRAEAAAAHAIVLAPMLLSRTMVERVLNVANIQSWIYDRLAAGCPKEPCPVDRKFRVHLCTPLLVGHSWQIR